MQYLHLLSQITINTSELGDEAPGQIIQEPLSFTSNTDFLIKNI